MCYYGGRSGNIKRNTGDNVRKYLLLVLFFVLMTVGLMPGAAQQAVAQLRVANFSPDAPVLEVWLNGIKSDIQTLQPNEMSGWVQITAGRHQIAFVPQGATLAEALVGPFNIDLGAGTWNTVPVLGLNSAGSIYAIWIDEDYPSPIPEGSTRITLFNGIPGSDAVDLLNSDGTPLARNVRFGRAANVDLPSGTHNLRIVPTGGSGGLATGDITLEANTYYLLGTVRRQSGGGLILRSVAQTLVSGLLSAQPAATATAPVATQPPTTPNGSPTALVALVTNTPQGTPPDFNPVTATPAVTLTPTLRPTLAGTLTPTRPPSEYMTILDMVRSSPPLSITLRGLDSVGLSERLGRDTFTFFVPTDDAWRELVDRYPDLLPDANAIRRVLAYHLVTERITTDIMFDQMTLLTVRGAFMRIGKTGDTIEIDGRANILIPDVEAMNGIIHIIDQVLIPPDMRPADMQQVRPLG
jgi:uncharacterized surface protein with fasciclin (FAS1) repeats